METLRFYAIPIFKPQRELYRQKISKAYENFTKLENKTHPFYEFLCPPNGESKFILIYDGNDANCENAKRRRALKGSKAQIALLDLFVRGGGSYVSQFFWKTPPGQLLVFVRCDSPDVFNYSNFYITI